MVVSYRRVIAELLAGAIKLIREEKVIEMKIGGYSTRTIGLERLKESYEELGKFIKETEEVMRLEAL